MSEDLKQRIARARNVLARAARPPGLESVGAPDSFEGLDAPGAPAPLDVPEAKEHMSGTATKLHDIVTEYLDGAQHLHNLVDDITRSGNRALNLLASGNDEQLGDDPEALSGLEAIVRTDGSRPTFLVRGGEVDTASSPLGNWESILVADASALATSLTCVGRIDNPSAEQGFVGTGFLIQEDLILTNRHVLQLMADRNDNGDWIIRPQVSIDFGHEYRGTASLKRRALRRVIFYGPSRIGEPVDHRKLDLALIELEPATEETRPRTVLGIDVSPDWLDGGPLVYTVGYPGSPSPWAYPPTLLEKLFQQTFGCKRLAPGKAAKSKRSGEAWTASHDATTLAGNSGSVVLIAGRPVLAAGLHYGGVNTEPAENWGHVLGRVLECKSSDGKTLGHILNDRRVTLVDRTLSAQR